MRLQADGLREFARGWPHEHATIDEPHDGATLEIRKFGKARCNVWIVAR